MKQKKNKIQRWLFSRCIRSLLEKSIRVTLLSRQFKYRRLASVEFGPWMGQPLVTQTMTVMEVAKHNLPRSKSCLKKKRHSKKKKKKGKNNNNNVKCINLFLTYPQKRKELFIIRTYLLHIFCHLLKQWNNRQLCSLLFLTRERKHRGEGSLRERG